MHTVVHAESLNEAKNNKGSCREYAKYLMKENDYFFSAESDEIPINEAISIIDNHAKGKLLKVDSKWFAPIYSLSEEESKYIVFILFGKNYDDFDELSEDEKKVFKNYIIELGREFQNQMAENFHKENLGIVSGKDLVYVGVVECQRKYKSFDDAVKSGKVKEGDLKRGFNTHIHIIQSRKANNKSKSKISPCINSRKQIITKLGTVQGFDRNEFINRVERSFDLKTGYDRSMEERFEYKKAKKKEEISIVLKDKKHNKREKNIKKKFYTREQIDMLSENADMVGYFFSLCEKGLLEFDKRNSEYYYFKKTNQKTGSIAVSKSGWSDFSVSNKGGKIIKAIMHFEGKSWYDAVSILNAEKFDKIISNDLLLREDYTKTSLIIADKPNVSVKSIKNLDDKYIIGYFESRGICKDIALSNLIEVEYSRVINGVERNFISGGMKNHEGSYNVRGYNFKGIVGNKNSFTEIKGDTKDKDYIIFEGFMDYLSYLELNGIRKLEERVYILNSVSNSNKLINHINSKNFNNVYALLNGDEKGNKATSLFMKNIANMKDIRHKYNITEKYDLNDVLLLRKIYENVKKIYH